MNLPVIGEIKLGGIGRIIIILLAVLYIVSPIDLIPDFIPVIGWIDDLIAGIVAFTAFIGGKNN